MLDDLRSLLGYSVPNDHSRQVVSEYYIDRVFAEHDGIRTVLDLGCGSGNSIDIFRKKNESIRWIGLDIESSPEVDTRTRTDAEFHTYDGTNIPFDDDYFDLIYCNHVFEHVRNPHALLREVHRVLKKGGFFIGSTSQLEPYHSHSLWNYTVYGFVELLNEARLPVVEIRPGIDALTLIVRRGLHEPRLLRAFWRRESPLNVAIGTVGRITRKTNADINLVKLVLCGQFCFAARRLT